MARRPGDAIAVYASTEKAEKELDWKGVLSDRTITAIKKLHREGKLGEQHPQHELLKSLANKDYGFGGLLGLDMETEDRSNRLMNHLQNATQFGFMAVNLGY
ncbi:hypothetical protein ACFE04_014932 [Oxalis oulophora]